MPKLWETRFPGAIKPRELTAEQFKWGGMYYLKPAGDRNRWSVRRVNIHTLIVRHLRKHPDLVGYVDYCVGYRGDTDLYLDALLQYLRLFRAESLRREALSVPRVSKSNAWDTARCRKRQTREWQRSLQRPSRGQQPKRLVDEPKYDPEVQLEFTERTSHRHGWGKGYAPTRIRCYGVEADKRCWKLSGRVPKQWMRHQTRE
jgi:hypothetical protein